MLRKSALRSVMQGPSHPATAGKVPAAAHHSAVPASAGDDLRNAEVSCDLGDEAFGGDHQQAFEADLAAVGQHLDNAGTADQRRHTVATAAPQVGARSAFIATVQLPTRYKSVQPRPLPRGVRRCNVSGVCVNMLT